MSEYRLHIDIPVGTSEPQAVRIAQQMISAIATYVQLRSQIEEEVKGMNYRLGNDGDRQKSNYLMVDHEGHVNNKKCRLTFTENKV